jgi:hypothetical protein
MDLTLTEIDYTAIDLAEKALDQQACALGRICAAITDPAWAAINKRYQSGISENFGWHNTVLCCDLDH